MSLPSLSPQANKLICLIFVEATISQEFSNSVQKEKKNPCSLIKKCIQ